MAPELGALPRAAPARRPVARRPAPGRATRTGGGSRRYSLGDDPLDSDDKAQIREGRRGPRPRPGPPAPCHAEGRELAAERWDGRRRRAGLAAGPGCATTAAAAAASWSGSPARWPTRSASAPTATPTTTAAVVTSDHGRGRALRGAARRESTSLSPDSPTTCFDTLDGGRGGGLVNRCLSLGSALTSLLRRARALDDPPARGSTRCRAGRARTPARQVQSHQAWPLRPRARRRTAAAPRSRSAR